MPSTPVDTPPSPPSAHRRPRRAGRILLWVLVVVLLLAGAGVGGAWLYVRDVDGDVTRIDAFGGGEQARPARAEAAGDALNFLVLGSDTRDPESAGGSRTDTIILMHLPKDRSGAQLVSIPRDTWVHVPKSADGKHGDVDAKINASFAWGGTPLMVQAVEEFTGVRVDHVLMVDFAGFKEIIDALGGVEVDVEQAFTSTHSLTKGGVRRFEAGPQTMDGATALDYARERYAFKDGDFARIRHQQQVIKAILAKASSGGILTNPAKLNAFLRATAGSVAVDDTLNLLGMAGDLRHLRGENLTFYTSPTTGTGTKGDQSVVLPDTKKAKEFYAAVRDDDADRIAATGTTK